MSLVLILLAVVFLAYANGSNDNFKGVATLFGSGTLSFRGALSWATVTTFGGSIAAVFLAGTLLKNFSGKGLVDDSLVSSPDYGAAVALGAGLTVLLASRAGMPVSTTHGLVGGLVGAGWAAGSPIELGKLGGSFFVPLLVSPLLALGLTVMFYPLFRFARLRLGIVEQTCFCVGAETVEYAPAMAPAAAMLRIEHLTARWGDTVTCQQRYQGRMLGLEVSWLVDRLHILSSGVVGFARGLNDTPKIAAMLLLTPSLTPLSGTAIVSVAIGLGGILGARKVAETMSQKITPMNPGQGFTANLITGVTVIAASNFGLPVSTTHVSCGSLFGIGAITGQGHMEVIGRIVGSWLLTLPIAAAMGAICYLAMAQI